jgi:hypothetical protein
MQELVDVCRWPLAINEPEIGEATLILSAVTIELERAARGRREAEAARGRVQEAMERLRAAIARARRAHDEARACRERSAELLARSARLRQGATGPDELPAVIRGWTTEREVQVGCADCGEPLVVSYRYRFMDGLVPKWVECPRTGCGGGLTFYFPVRCEGLAVRAAAPGRAPMEALTA